MKKLKEKAIAMLENCDIIVLSSINKERYPRPVQIVHPVYYHSQYME